VQLEAVRSIEGFGHAHITRPGYAIEYDYFDPRDLRPTLETRAIDGLFFAGQINGTTGYEEAAAQGLVAGINATRTAQEREGWWPKRSESYLGVLIDDLITRGVTEPYRMFTSRAEYRLSLREDNADLRLTEKGRELGVVDDRRWQRFVAKRDSIACEQQRLRGVWLKPGMLDASEEQRVLGAPLAHEYNLLELLRRPEVRYPALMALPGAGPAVDDAQVTEQIEIQAKYAGYIERQQDAGETSVSNQTPVNADQSGSAISPDSKKDKRRREAQRRQKRQQIAGPWLKKLAEAERKVEKLEALKIELEAELAGDLVRRGLDPIEAHAHTRRSTTCLLQIAPGGVPLILRHTAPLERGAGDLGRRSPRRHPHAGVAGLVRLQFFVAQDDRERAAVPWRAVVVEVRQRKPCARRTEGFSARRTRETSGSAQERRGAADQRA